jgi:hypothetical protein
MSKILKSACTEFVVEYDAVRLTATFTTPYTERETKRYMTLAALRSDMRRTRETFRQMAREERAARAAR